MVQVKVELYVYVEMWLWWINQTCVEKRLSLERRVYQTKFLE